MNLKITTKVLACLLFPFITYSNFTPSHAVNAGTKSYFINTDQNNISKLWITDGTSAGTKEAYPDSPSMPQISLNSSTLTRDLLIGLNNKVIFKASSSASGEELWISDGTAAGTSLLKDIKPGSGSSDIQAFIKLNNKVVFLANDGVHEQELWITDGTSAGTKLIKDLDSGYSFFSEVDTWKVLNNKLYFGRKQSLIWPELWVTDGTESGTKNIKSAQGNGMFNPKNFLADGNIVFFQAVDGMNTKYLHAVNENETFAHSLLYYFMDTPLQGQVLNNKLLFRHPSNGTEIWISDGTEAGTNKLQSPAQTNRIVNTTNFYKHQNQVYFNGNNNDWGGDLWKTNGTESGTLRVQSGMPFDWVYQPMRNGQALSINNNFYFEGNYYTGSSTELWKSDGSHNGTTKIKTFNTPQTSLEIKQENVIGSKFFFRVINPASTDEDWISDGTENGTIKIQDISSSFQLTDIKVLTHSSTDLYFSAKNNNTEYHLFKTNGTSTTILTSNQDDCPQTLAVNSPISVNSDLKAAQSISGNNKVLTPAKVNLSAGNKIELSPGFEAQNGSTFTAIIGGCE